jgi:cobalt-zinc-cadmium efflux system outer membrane protein
MSSVEGAMWKTCGAPPPIDPGRPFAVMRGILRHQGLIFVLALCGSAGRAFGQAATVDTSVPALPGGSGSLLGSSPGDNSSMLGTPPGAGGSARSANLPSAGILGGRAGPNAARGVPASVTTPATGAGPAEMQMPVTAPQPQPVGPSTPPLYGTLELGAGPDEDEPADGLPLEQAIEITLQRSLDLRSKFAEIPMARADILQASLRANPVFYQDGQLLQYGRGEYSRARPGGPQQFDTNVTYPLDVSFKRRARTTVAARAQKVLEAQYQDAVRSRIDDVYGAYVTALGGRQTVRYAKRSVEGLGRLTELTRQLYQRGQVPLADLNLVENKLRIARLGVRAAEAAFRSARLDLGSLMNLTVQEASDMKLRGRIEVQASPPPPLDELRQIALADRPDLGAYRLGITRAQADVRLARANAFSDVYLLWQPYTFQDNSPYGVKSATSWALGATVPLPIYNRNQGGILRAKINVDQSRMQLADAERQVLVDVEKAMQEYEISRALVQELHDQVEPDARKVRDAAFRLWQGGETSLLNYLQAQLDYNDVVKQYLDTAIRHRQSMLSLNTTIGRRIMP